MHVNMHGGDAVAFKKGKWSEEEDEKLRAAVNEYGIQNWVAIEKFSGLGRPSKNCRLRWFNHLRPNLKKCPFTQEEERIILRLHHKYGNSWSLIASEVFNTTWSTFVLCKTLRIFGTKFGSIHGNLWCICMHLIDKTQSFVLVFICGLSFLYIFNICMRHFLSSVRKPLLWRICSTKRSMY